MAIVESGIIYDCHSWQGWLAALAAWTKNEGSLFLIATVIAHIVIAMRSGQYRRALRQSAVFGLGLLPVSALLVYFKLPLAPDNDLLAGQGWEATWHRLISFKRATA